jgi:hypothetical protein
LLHSFTIEEWHLPTSSSRRSFKDIVSHLLDGSLRWLSGDRDRYSPPDGASGIRPGESLVEFLDRLNAQWESATRRLSPQVLIGLTEWVLLQYLSDIQSLDPFATATYPVTWAGEEQSCNWMDIARNYTERWHHAQQVFDATKRPSPLTSRRRLVRRQIATLGYDR